MKEGVTEEEGVLEEGRMWCSGYALEGRDVWGRRVLRAREKMVGEEASAGGMLEKRSDGGES